jgi:ribosomal protein S27AE
VGDDRIICPGCGRGVVPRLWHYGGTSFTYARVQHLCPFCGLVMYETGGGIRWGCLAPVLLLVVVLAVLGYLFDYARFG